MSEAPRTHRRVLLWLAVCSAFALAPFFFLAVLHGGRWLLALVTVVGIGALWLIGYVLTRGRWPGWYEKVWDRTYGRPRP